MPRDTGAQHYFAVPLVKAWEIFKDAYANTSGLCRTVRGPIMSASPGKIQVTGVTEIFDEKVMVLLFLQARDTEWIRKPFLAKYNKDALWLDDLKPAFGKKEFYCLLHGSFIHTGSYAHIKKNNGHIQHIGFYNEFFR